MTYILISIMMLFRRNKCSNIVVVNDDSSIRNIRM